MALPEMISGQVWKLGDHVNTDLLHPPTHFTLDGKRVREGIEEGRARLGSIRSEDGSDARWIMVAGKNVGCGSSRETSVRGLSAFGVLGVVASSFARIFMRNLVNYGIPVFECREIQKDVQEGDWIRISLREGWIETQHSKRYLYSEIDPHLRKILEAGGLLNYLWRERDGI